MTTALPQVFAAEGIATVPEMATGSATPLWCRLEGTEDFRRSPEPRQNLQDGFCLSCRQSSSAFPVEDSDLVVEVRQCWCWRQGARCVVLPSGE